MKREEYERSDKQNILKLRREKDEFAKEIVDLKKEIDFLNCQLRVRNKYVKDNFMKTNTVMFLENKRFCRE